MKTSNFFRNMVDYKNIFDISDKDLLFVIQIYENGQYYYLEELSNNKIKISDQPCVYDNYENAEEDMKKLIKIGYHEISVVPYNEIYFNQ